MKNISSRMMLAVLFALLLAGGTLQGASISGAITTTKIITGSNQLTGNMTCNVPGGAPCIKFGAHDTQLHLNGFVITGDNGSLTSCKASTNQTAIDTAGYSNAQIHGPGLITSFTGNGVIVSGSNSEVHQVVITGVCFNGIVVGNNIPADGYNHVHQNSISLFALPPNGANGIAVLGTGNNQIEQNVITGGGANGYGIIVVTSSDSNRIQQNNFSGNAAGIVVYRNSLSNIIQENQVLGNTLLDIFDPNSVHSNTYNDNLCQVSSGPGAPVCPGTIPTAVIGNQ